jgi:hypothetical protein
MNARPEVYQRKRTYRLGLDTRHHVMVLLGNLGFLQTNISN